MLDDIITQFMLFAEMVKNLIAYLPNQ